MEQMNGWRSSAESKKSLLSGTAVLFLVLTAGIIVQEACNSKGTQRVQNQFLNHNPKVSYVGIQKCAECHQDKYQTFKHTGMGLSFDSASHTKSSAYFKKDHIVFDSVKGFYYYPFWKDQQLFIREYKIDGEDTIHSLIQKIDYIIGSGQHTNSHLFKQGKYIYQAPLTFYTQEGKWDLPPGFENGNNQRFSRVINAECMSCHNAMPRMAESSAYQFVQIGKGIDCERCHGPGELHVKKWENEQTKITGNDLTIVNPSKLSMDLQIDICQRCHLQGNNILQEGKKFTDFKPGMHLHEVFQIFLPVYEGENPKFNMANHAERMQKSNCFIASQQTNKPMTCISCHNPHVSHKAMGKNYFNDQCLACHSPNSTLFTVSKYQHTAQSNCINCHMPVSNSRDIPHVTVHDHWIQAKPKNSTENSEIIGLKSINGGKVSNDKMILAYLSYFEKFDKNPFHLNKAKDLLEKSADIELRIHYLYLVEDWPQVINLAEKISPEKVDAWTAYRIGVAYQMRENWVSSIVWLQSACKTQKDMVNFWQKLGNAQLNISDIDGAHNSYTKAKNINPLDATVWNNLGIIYARKSEAIRAKEYFEKAIQLDPNYLLAYQNALKLTNTSQNLNWKRQLLNQMKKNQLPTEQILPNELLQVIN